MISDNAKKTPCFQKCPIHQDMLNPCMVLSTVPFHQAEKICRWECKISGTAQKKKSKTKFRVEKGRSQIQIHLSSELLIIFATMVALVQRWFGPQFHSSEVSTVTTRLLFTTTTRSKEASYSPDLV